MGVFTRRAHVGNGGLPASPAVTLLDSERVGPALPREEADQARRDHDERERRMEHEDREERSACYRVHHWVAESLGTDTDHGGGHDADHGCAQAVEDARDPWHLAVGHVDVGQAED